MKVLVTLSVTYPSADPCAREVAARIGLEFKRR